MDKHIFETIELGNFIIDNHGRLDDVREYENRVQRIRTGLANLPNSNQANTWMHKLDKFNEQAYHLSFIQKIFYFISSARFTRGQNMSTNSLDDKFKRYVLEVNMTLHIIDSSLSWGTTGHNSG